MFLKTRLPEDFFENFELPPKPPFKAAILPQTGTLSKVDFTPRPKPKPKKAMKLHQKGNFSLLFSKKNCDRFFFEDSTRTQTAFSLGSVPIDIPDSEDVITTSGKNNYKFNLL